MKRTLFSRLLSLTLCLVFLVGLVPVAFAADELNGNISGTTTITVGETTTLSVSGTTGSLKWTVSGNGSIEGSDTSSSVVVKGTAAGSVTVTVTETIPAAGETPETTKTGSTTITVNPPATTDVTGVTVTPSTASITVNGTVNLIAKVAPDNATNKTVVWTSSDNNVATVDSGIVTGKRAGTATITATTADGEKTSTCQVTVTAPVVTPPTLNITSSSLLVGGTITLSVNNPPSGATFNWSGNSNVTLGNNGGSSNTVTGRTVSSNNTVSVQVTSGGTTTTLNCTINVVNPYINPTSASLNVGQTVGLSVSNLPSNASVIWSRTNTTITNFSGSGTSITVSADRAGYSDYTATVTANGKSVTTATCRVTVNNTSSSTTASTINRTVKNSDVLTFSRSNFNDVKPSSAGTIDYIYFTDLPSSRGTLYYNYRESSGNYDHSISASSSSSYRYYYSPSGSQNDLSLISFVPKSGTGSTTLSYYAVTSGTNYSGSITITVEEGVNKVNFNVAKNNVLKLSSSDFNTACKNLNGSNLEYIEFDELPTSSQGTLYLNYSSSSGSGTSVKTGTRYYRSGTPSIDDISFVPKNNYTGTVTLAYSARDVNSKYFSGKLTIRVGTGSGDVSYSANAGTAVTFKIADFNTYCKDETGYNLDYVQFSLPSSSKGTLYYDYTSSSNYGSTVDTRTKYYYSGSSSKSYLSKVTFVPANNTTGTVTIDFTGLNDNGRSFSGTVSIDYTGTVSNPSTIYYSSAGASITFNKSDFVTACSNRGGSPLSSVKFTLPAESLGKLYYNYTNATTYGGLVSASTSYDTATGNSSISAVTFVPAPGYSGTATLYYTGTDTSGNTYTGSIMITITQASGVFTDMGNHVWAQTAVNSLYQRGIITGQSATEYGPANALKRGDFVLMLYRAFNLTATNTTNNFTDVPKDSYYATAINVANALGIAQGGDGIFRPEAPLTREDAMILIQRTLTVKGRPYPAGTSTTLSKFPDSKNISSYAVDAAAALVQASVITGDEKGNLNPKKALTRAEMAVILYRVLPS